MALHYLYLLKIIPPKAKHFTLQLLLTLPEALPYTSQCKGPFQAELSFVCFSPSLTISNILFTFLSGAANWVEAWRGPVMVIPGHSQLSSTIITGIGQQHKQHLCDQADNLLSLVAQLKRGRRMVKDHQGVWGDRLVEPASLRQEQPPKIWSRVSYIFPPAARKL